jgi:hypothetical protein
MTHYSVEQRVDIIRHAVVGLVRRDGHDLTARQLGVFLTTYLEGEAQTVRGLAAELNVAKPVISRAPDRLHSSIWCADGGTRWTGAAYWCSARWRDKASCASSKNNR